MSGTGPKLYANKPKKTKLKQNQVETGTTAMASSGSMGIGEAPPRPPPPPPPPPPPVKESFARRYRFLWPLLLAVNFSVGAYLFMRTRKKDVVESAEEDSLETTTTSTTSTTIAEAAVTSVLETPVTPLIEPPAPRPPIPEDQQRELFKWILEEKRKVKPSDAEEKKRIDEEKAILKQFIRAKSIPSL